MFTSEQLKKDDIYTRDKLRQMFSIRDATIKNGVFRPAGYQSVWLFVTENKTKNSTQYKDLLYEDRLDWDGQTKGRTDRLIIEHEIKGIELLVFYRKNRSIFPHGGFKYEGQFRYVSHTGSKPTHFVLERVASVTIKDSGEPSKVEDDHKENAPYANFVNEHAYNPKSNKPSVLMEQKVPLKMFYCYAHEDYPLLKRLENHLSVLKRLYNIVSWFDQAITPGMEWKKEIDAQLNTADIILLLVSPDFMASDYCYGVEMKRAIERHERGEAKVIPIILYPIGWQDTPLGKLQALPRSGKPVVDSSWGNRSNALHNVEEGLKVVIRNLVSMPSASSAISSLRIASAHLEVENGQDLIVFKQRGQEDAYRKWVLAHRDDGLIVVKDVTRWRLHHATCRHIIDPIEKGQSLLTYPKICSTSRAKLDTEATKQGGTILTGCYCQQ
jgi:TIR domain